MSFHSGNNILFTIATLDNYTAGTKAIGVINSDKNRLEQIRYGDDEYSNLYAMRIKYSTKTLTLAQASARIFPEMLGEIQNSEIIGSVDLLIEKDARDRIVVSYQLSGVSYNDDIVVGPGFSKYNPLVNGVPDYNKLKFVGINKKTGPHELTLKPGTFTEHTMADSIFLLDSTYSQANEALFFSPNPVGLPLEASKYSSWALVHPDTNEIVLAVNEDIFNTKTCTPLVFYFRRNKQNFDDSGDGITAL
jgi:hypothetical protein